MPAALSEIITNLDFRFNAGKLAAIERGVGRSVRHLDTMTTKVDAFGAQVGGMVGRIKQFVAAYVGIRAAQGVTSDIAAQVSEIERGAEFLGITVTRAQELRHAGLRNRVQYEDVVDVMKELAVKANDAFGIAKSKDAQELFKQMGIVKSQVVDTNGALKSTDELLMVVADAYTGMGNKAKQAAAIDDLLSDSGRRAAKFLALGRKGIEQFAKEAHDRGIILDERTIDAARRYKKVKGEVIVTLTAFRNVVAGAVLPVVVRLIETLMRWWKAISNNERAMRALKITVLLLGAVLASVFAAKASAQLQLFAKGLLAAARAFRLLGIQAAIAHVATFAYLIALGLIVLAIEDLIGFAQGKDSIIGRLLGDSELANDLRDAVVGIGRAMISVWRAVKPALLEVWAALKPALKELWEAAKPFAGALFRAGIFVLVHAFKALAILIRIVAFGLRLVGKILSTVFKGLKTVFGPIVDMFKWLVSKAERLLEIMGIISGKQELGAATLQQHKELARQNVIRQFEEELEKPTIGPGGEVIKRSLSAPLAEILDRADQPAFFTPGRVRAVGVPPAPGPAGLVGRLPEPRNEITVAPGAIPVEMVINTNDPQAVGREANKLLTVRVPTLLAERVNEASRNRRKPPRGGR